MVPTRRHQRPDGADAAARTGGLASILLTWRRERVVGGVSRSISATNIVALWLNGFCDIVMGPAAIASLARQHGVEVRKSKSRRHPSACPPSVRNGSRSSSEKNFFSVSSYEVLLLRARCPCRDLVRGRSQIIGGRSEFSSGRVAYRGGLNGRVVTRCVNRRCETHRRRRRTLAYFGVRDVVNNINE
eukprot:2262961-Pyramimonas_sp.AAC.1